MKIRTEHVYPPIPIRQFDWCAYDEDTYCGCGECHPIVGTGETEAEAVADFREQAVIHDLATEQDYCFECWKAVGRG